MEAIDFARQQLTQARAFLEGTLADVTDEQAQAVPPGVLNPIGATYAHLVAGEDGFVNGLLRGEAPLFATAWAGRTGFSEPLPNDDTRGAWARRVRVDIPALRAYAAAVAQSTDAWLAGLTPDDLGRSIDLSSFGLGEQRMGWVIGLGVTGHVLSHWGEICALKGIYGGSGFPV